MERGTWRLACDKNSWVYGQEHIKDILQECGINLYIDVVNSEDSSEGEGQTMVWSISYSYSLKVRSLWGIRSLTIFYKLVTVLIVDCKWFIGKRSLQSKGCINVMGHNTTAMWS